MIRILLADDHPVVRRGIVQIATEAGDLVVVGEAATGHELLERARTLEHDVVVLDLSMPDAQGVDLLAQLKRERPKIPVLILTMHAEHVFAIRAFKAGAAGYLLKDSALAHMVEAVHKVAAGGRYVSSAMAECLAGYLSDSADQALHERLSDREYEVFRLIASGASTRRISEDLSLSIKTVGTYRSRIFEKMQIHSPAELAAYAVRHKLID